MDASCIGVAYRRRCIVANAQPKHPDYHHFANPPNVVSYTPMYHNPTRDNPIYDNPMPDNPIYAHHLSILRDERSPTADFRRASDRLARLLCAETLAKLGGDAIALRTPLGSAPGIAMPRDVLLAPILRAAIAILPAFTDMLPDAPVAIVGVERDEATALPSVYYKKIPPELPARAVVLDPMLATGGSACAVVDLLTQAGCAPENIYFSGVIGCPEGIDRLASVIPRANITLAAVDPTLDARKFIVPGLGDYGDRYFGA